jgi:hypothetical protein
VATKRTTASRDTLSETIDLLSTALTMILQQARMSTDDTKLLQLNNEYHALQALLNQATRAELAANDAIFDRSTQSFKAQARALEGMADHIKLIISDVKIASEVAGYIVQVLALVATL